jgi:hypothetical protein
LSLRTAYLIHLVYNRVWGDMIAPRLGLCPPDRHFYVRYRTLAHLFRRTRFRLFGGSGLIEAAHARLPQGSTKSAPDGNTPCAG